MKNVTVEIADWDAEHGRTALNFLAAHGDFDLKNLTLEDHSYLYEHGFGAPAKLVSAYDRQGEKVGHAVLYERDLRSADGEKCYHMSDLYVDSAYRNLPTISRMYSALKAYLEHHNVEAMFCVSNERSTRLNERFLHIFEHEELRFGVGISNCFVGNGGEHDVTTDILDPASSTDFSAFFRYSNLWDVNALRKRLNLHGEAFKVHCFGDALVVSQRTRKLGIPLVLIVGLFSREENRPKLDRKILNKVCSSHRVPFYCTEVNDLSGGVLKNFLFVKKLSVYHRDMPQDQRYCLLDLDLSLGVA